ncbi:MAG: hypothetical protein H8E45_08620 [Proteobacteria bacterium]|nr:hypothetical protein [Pseudomonadota bacterium]
MKHTIQACPLPLLILTAAALLTTGARADIVNSPHDLSISGPGPTAVGEDEVCIFCHTPHNASPATPLWNRLLPSLSYEPYSSSTLAASPGQPTGASKLCLSCHDGTIALGTVLGSPPLGLQETVSGRADITTDLSDDHPVSFSYTDAITGGNQELVDPALLSAGPVHLDASGQLQCTACHEPHGTGNPDFLVMADSYAALCTSCHQLTGWQASAHATSSATWNGAGPDPWPVSDGVTTAENACYGCHASHSAAQPRRLLTSSTEEDGCLACHSGSVTAVDIATTLQKFSAHPVDASAWVHDPTEDPVTMPRHVECQDCHDPHSANGSSASAPFASGALEGAPGVDIQGLSIDGARFEYEVCLRCHMNDTTTVIQRQSFEPDLSARFDTSASSFHPVAGPGRNPDVPSLIAPLNEGSQIYCSDCHNNDNGPGAGGNGPAGPHGSNWPQLLEREYTLTDGSSENFQTYSLCYKCHSRSSILGDESFSEHSKHIEKETTSCATCHDPHGVAAGTSSTINNSHLVNFNLNEVLPNSQGDLFFQDNGSRAGTCYLECHGEDHIDKNYP